MPQEWSWWGAVTGSRCARATTPAVAASTAAPNAAFRRVISVIVMRAFFASTLRKLCETGENQVRISRKSSENRRPEVLGCCR